MTIVVAMVTEIFKMLQKHTDPRDNWKGMKIVVAPVGDLCVADNTCACYYGLGKILGLALLYT